MSALMLLVKHNVSIDVGKVKQRKYQCVVVSCMNLLSAQATTLISLTWMTVSGMSSGMNSIMILVPYFFGVKDSVRGGPE